MLAAVDRVLAPLSWLLAAAAVVLLLIGPEVVAKDETQPQTQAAGAAPYAAAGSGGGTAAAATDGKAIFTDNCGSCHTLSDAGTSGIAGPNLDGRGLDAETVSRIVTGGQGGMPAFDDTLSDGQIEAVAAYVAQASGG